MIGCIACDLVQRAALIFHLSPEEMSRQLILHIFDALFICVAEEKPIMRSSKTLSIKVSMIALSLGSPPSCSKKSGPWGCIQNFVENALPGRNIRSSENKLHHSELEPGSFGHFARIPWRLPHEIKFHIGNTRNGSHLVFNLRRQ